MSQWSRANVTSRSAANTTVIACFPRSSARGEDAEERYTPEAAQAKRWLYYRVSRLKTTTTTTTNKKKKAPEVERLRQVEMMADRESERRQLELAAQTVMARLRGPSVTKLHAMATGSATRCTYGCHHLRNSTLQSSATPAIPSDATGAK